MTEASNAVSVRIKHLTVEQAKGQRRHDLREGPVPNYVDKDKSKDNTVLLKPSVESEAREICEHRRSQRNPQRRLKSNANVLTAGVLTFGKGAQEKLAGLTPAEQDSRALRAAQAVADALNTDLESLVCHRDESALHYHFRLYSVDRNGLPLSKTVNRATASGLQDIAAEAYQDLGITRGTPKAERLARGDDLSKIVHRSVQQLHEDLPREIEARQRERDELERQAAELKAKIEKNERLIQEQQRKLEAGRATEEQAVKRIATYERRAEAARKALDELQGRMQDAEGRAQQAEQRAQQAEQRELDAQARASQVVEVPPAPKLPETVNVDVVVERGLFKSQIQTMAVVPAAQVREYKTRWENRDHRQQVAMGKMWARADSAEKSLNYEKTKTKALKQVLEAIAKSEIVREVVNRVPAFADWLRQAGKQLQRAPSMPYQDDLHQAKGRSKGPSLDL